MLGRPVLRQLATAGHRMTVFSHSPERDVLFRELGATPHGATLFDPKALATAMAKMGGFDAVLHLATHIPPLHDMQRAEA